MNRRRFTIGLFFLIALNLCSTAQAPVFLSYSLAEGLPQSQVFAAVQDRKGYLWLGTQGGGLCRFDGQDFQTYTTEQGLPSNYINTLWEDSAGRLWIGTNAGIAFMLGNSIEKIPAVESRGLQVFAFSQGPDSAIWLGTDRGLYTCDPNAKTLRKLHLPPLPENSPVWAFFTSASGWWIATDAGAFRVGGVQTLHLHTRNGLAANAVRGFCQSAGQLWIATAGGGLSVVDEPSGKLLRRYPAPAWTTALLAGRDGRVWVGTSDNGLALFNSADSSWSQVTEKQGFPHHYVRTLCADNTGNVWAGTSGGGIVKFIGSQPFTRYGAAQGLAGNRVYALHQDQQGRLLLAVSQAGLQVLDTSGIGPFVRDSGWLSGVKTKTVAEDQLGRIWVGTEGKGLTIFDTAGRRLTPKLPSNIIQKIIPGAAGEMWVATTAGISRVAYQPGDIFSIRNFGRQDGLKGLIISTLYMDTGGGLWFADQLGNLGLIQNQRVEKVWTQEDGLPGTPIRCLAIGPSGRLWAGTKGSGIFQVDETQDPIRFIPLVGKKPTSDNIYLLLFDASGNLWAGSESGVDRLMFKNGKVIDLQHFGRNEGFLGIETCQDAALLDPWGHLWFGTMNGLMKYTPNSRKAAGVAPILHLESVDLFYKPIEQTRYAAWAAPLGGLLPGLTLPWNENHLSFEFRAVDLAHPDAVRYRWRLEGAPNAQWSPLSAQTAVNFAGLQPGVYTFQVQATADGERFSETASAAFNIRKPFWQRLDFQLALGLAILGLMALVARARIRRVQRAEAEKRAQLELQNYLLQLEQKALQLQMNPHFIFNALNSIQSLVGTGEATAARTQIGAFAQLMRSILNNSRKPLISLQAEVDTLEQYLRLEQFCQPAPFAFSITLPQGADAEELEIPPMLIQPFVENAVIHGIAPLQKPGQLDITFALEGDLLRCTIRDNGIGREAAARLRQERKPGHQSVAMGVTRERLEAMRQGATYEALQINDLAPERGTEVIVRMPVKRHF